MPCARRAWIGLLLLAAVSLSLPRAAAGRAEFRVGTWKTAQTIQPFYYQDHMPAGTVVTVYPFTNPADQKTALLAGSLDMCGTTIAHAIHSAVQGQPVVIVAALCHRCSALVVRRDGPVAVAADLRGRTLGYVPGTMHEVLLREVLDVNGLAPGRDVRLMRIDFFDMGTALARGAIDGFLSGEPFPTQAVVRGYGRILAYPYFDGTIGTLNAGLLVRRATIAAVPDRVLALVEAHARATAYLQAHPEAWLAKAAAFGTPVAVLEQAAPNMELAWDMDAAFVARARALGERMARLGMIARQPDYEVLFDLSFVERVRRDLRPMPRPEAAP